MNLQYAIYVIKRYPNILSKILCRLDTTPKSREYLGHPNLHKECIKVDYDHTERSIETYYQVEHSSKLDHYSALATEEDVISYANKIIKYNKKYPAGLTSIPT